MSFYLRFLSLHRMQGRIANDDLMSITIHALNTSFTLVQQKGKDRLLHSNEVPFELSSIIVMNTFHQL